MTNSFIKYCPNCGSQHHEFFELKKFSCFDCGFVLYHNTAAAVAVIFLFQDQVLFTVRNQAPDIGKLDLPGGFIDPNETAEEAACREIKEELGLELLPSDLKFIGTQPNDYLFKQIPYKTLDIFFEVTLSSQEILIWAKDEIKSLVWYPKKEIPIHQIGFKSMRILMQDYISN